MQHQSVQHWTSGQLADVFEQLTGVRYSHSHWCSLLRHQQGMYYYKPRPCDYRRADEAEEQLRARIQATFDALQAMGYDLQRVKWGFADEVAAQLHSNNARFWAFEPHLSRVVNTDRGSQSFFGFYGIKAASHLVDLADGKMESIQQALLAKHNKQIARLWWCFGTMPAVTNAWKPGAGSAVYSLCHCRPIVLSGPPPRLNPIEQVWKSVKRWLNQTQFVKELTELSSLFQAGFAQLKDQLSFTASWWETYQDQLSWYRLIFNSNTSQ